jgi:glucose/arabinose dehydrogenase
MTPLTRRPSLAAALVALALGAAACGSATGSPTPRPQAATPGPSAPASPPEGTTPDPGASAPGGSFDPAATGVAFEVVADVPRPVAIADPGDNSGRLFVVDQGGRIWLVRDGQRAETPFLDIADRVTAGGEQGLLGLAFAPTYPDDPRFFVYYTDSDGQQVVSQWRVASADADQADGDSEAVLLRMDDFAPNHNGGALVFGPDGYLYISTGDGGGGGDPQGNGQKLDTLLGKVLRIDVDASGVGQPYSIPADNPFVERAGARQEIWLYGLRNPWRISFDRATGDLWIGDVGQGAYEEIDVVRAGSGGGQNFGWNTTEGFHCYPSGDPCAPEGLTPPVTEYDHSFGCSVTGGFVYRGTAYPALAGGYLFADYCSGNVWLIDAVASEVREPRLALESGRSISSFGEDVNGEVYATDLGAGELLRVVAVAP